MPTLLLLLLLAGCSLLRGGAGEPEDASEIGRRYADLRADMAVVAEGMAGYCDDLGAMLDTSGTDSASIARTHNPYSPLRDEACRLAHSLDSLLLEDSP